MYPNIPPNQFQGQQPPNQFPGQYPPAGYPNQQMPYPGYDQAQAPYPQQQFGAAPGYPPMPQMDNPYGNYQQPPQMGGYPQQPPQMGGYPQQPPQMGAYPQQAPQMGAYPPQGNYPQQPMMQQQVYQQQQQAPGAYGQQAAPPRGRPTVVPANPFDACNDASVLRKAMKGFGTDEDAIINVVCKRSASQRMEIVKAFKTAYGKDLLDDIRKETEGNFHGVLNALLTPPVEYICRELYEAMYGEGTDEDVLIEVMIGMTNREIRSINHLYGQMFGKTLEDEMKSDTSGSFKRLMVSLATGNRDESTMTDVNSARMDAQQLKAAGVGRWGTDESEFNRILCLRNFEQIKLISQEYEKLTGHTLEKDIKKEFSGDIEDGLVSILRCALSRSEFFAKRIHKSMAGIGTDDKALIRLIVTRCEIDMVDIKEAFQKKFGKTLKSFVKGDTSGHYKHALYQLIGENRS